MLPRLAFLALILVASAPPLLAQGSPSWSYRQGGHNQGLYMIDSSRGVIAADGGRMMYTVDGTTWIEADVPEDVRGDLRGVHFVDSNHGYACGDNGVVLETTTGGDSWTWINETNPITNQTLDEAPAELWEIWMFPGDPSPTHGYCVGNDGVVAYTEDNWDNWVHTFDPGILGPDPQDFYDVLFLDSSTGWVAGDYGTVLRFDGSTGTWDPVVVTDCEAQHVDLELWSLAFWDAMNGVVVGGTGTNHGVYARTTDGGQSWEQITCSLPFFNPVGGLCSTQTPYGVTALATGQAVAVAYASGVFWYDTGVTGQVFDQCPCAYTDVSATSCPGVWVQTEPVMATATEPPLSVIRSLSPTEMWLAGRFGVIGRYDSVSGTWIDQGTVDYLRLHDGDFYSASEGAVIGQGHVIKRTDDGGDTWTTVYPLGAPDYEQVGRAIAFSPSGQRAVAVGTGGFTAYSGDYGVTWSGTSSGTTADLHGVCYATEDAVYTVGTGGTIRKSYDGGQSWSQILPQLPTSKTLRGVSFAIPSVGYLVGDGKTVFKTTSWGVNWDPVDAVGPDELVLHDVVAWGDGTQAIAVGEGGTVLELSAGGDFVPASGTGGVTETLFDVEEVDDGYIRICGGNGRILMRDDPMDDFSSPKSQTSETLYKVSFDTATHGFSVGQQFLIAEYTQ